jgi:hypothetical protein
MNFTFFIIVDSLMVLGFVYACCAKVPDPNDELSIHTPLKNENYLNYEECGEISSLV